MNLETVAIREIVIEMIEKTKTEKVLDTVEGEDKVKRDAVIYGIFA